MTAVRTKRRPKPAWMTALEVGSWQPGSRDVCRSFGARSELGSVRFDAQGGRRSHPLADGRTSSALAARASRIANMFAPVTDMIAALAPKQFQPGFARLAVDQLREGLGIIIAEDRLSCDWKRPVDLVALHAEAVVGVFARLVAESVSQRQGAAVDGEEAGEVIRRWGFHAVAVTTCADGRVAGLLDHVLRVPAAIISARKSRAGAMFQAAEALADWEAVELRRLTGALPAVEGDTRYLKIGVYHFSSLAPAHEGCAAHGSDERKAAQLLLDRLAAFAAAVERRHGAGQRLATLLIGHDTDTDAIRIHVPGPEGVSIDRFVSSLDLYTSTQAVTRDAAKEAVRAAVAKAAGTTSDDPATQGTRWFCGYLLKNNIAQVDAVLARFGGPYPVAGHEEKLAVIGDPVDEAQLRNLAFQAQMNSVEEGAGDLDVGVRILGARLASAGLAVPVLVLRQFAPDIPGDEDRAIAAALSMQQAVAARYSSPDRKGVRVVPVAAVRPAGGGAPRLITPTPCRHHDDCACKGAHA